MMAHRQVLKALSSNAFISKYSRMKIYLCSFIVVIILRYLEQGTKPLCMCMETDFGLALNFSVL